MSPLMSIAIDFWSGLRSRSPIIDMKASFFGYVAAICFAASAHATIYQTDFNNVLTFPGPDVAGSDGWVINDATPNLSFLPLWNGSQAAALGGFFDAPAVSPVALTHSYGEAFGHTQMSFLFTINDSSASFPNRDAFGISLANGANNLFTVFFTPAAQVADPTLPPDAVWNLTYATGNDAPTSLTQGVLEGGTYSFSLIFTPNGASTDFNLTVVGANSENRTGTVAVAPATVATDFGLNWIPNIAGAGDNFFIIDNLAVVPEASTSAAVVLVGLAGLGVLARRKRA